LFAMLGGLAGTALFAHLHERLIPLLYDPTNLGPVTVTAIVGHPAVALIVVLSAFAAAIILIGKVWQDGTPTD